MFTLGGWSGIEWQAKVIIYNGCKARVTHPKISLEGFAGSLMAEMKQNLH